MSFQELRLTYGYPMLFVGVLIESEAVLLIGIYLAQQGYFSLPTVIGVAALSSFVAAQLCFFSEATLRSHISVEAAYLADAV